jgi:hypothetical protein
MKETLDLVSLKNTNMSKATELLKEKNKRNSKKLSVFLEDEMSTIRERTEQVDKAMKGLKAIHKSTIDAIEKKIYFKKCE